MSVTTDVKVTTSGTGTPMFSMQMLVEVPAGQPISELKQTFADLWDEYNFDGSLTVEK